MKRIVLVLVMLFSLVLAAGCSNSEPTTTNSPQSEAPEMNQIEQTPLSIEFKVEPTELKVKKGETFTINISVKNTSKEAINGMKIWVTGPWDYIVEKSLKPEKMNGVFTGSIIFINEFIPPGQELPVELSGKIGDMLSEKESGYELSFSPTVTNNGREFVVTNDDDLKTTLFVTQ